MVLWSLIPEKNPQYDFLKMRGRGGGQRPFGTFPKNHPFWILSILTFVIDFQLICTRLILLKNSPPEWIKYWSSNMTIHLSQGWLICWFVIQRVNVQDLCSIWHKLCNSVSVHCICFSLRLGKSVDEWICKWQKPQQCSLAGSPLEWEAEKWPQGMQNWATYQKEIPHCVQMSSTKLSSWSGQHNQWVFVFGYKSAVKYKLW